ncbi:MAG: hypothetical protein WAU48_10655 [Gammaproteobacteria bacterium]
MYNYLGGGRMEQPRALLLHKPNRLVPEIDFFRINGLQPIYRQPSTLKRPYRCASHVAYFKLQSDPTSAHTTVRAAMRQICD